MLVRGHGVSPGVIIALVLFSITSILYATARLSPTALNWVHRTGSTVRLSAPAQHDAEKSIPPITGDLANTHNELFSELTPDGSYFPIVFGNYLSINPNIIPHPEKRETWVIVAQQHKRFGDNQAWCAELVCDAVFTNHTLACVIEPMILTIAHTVTELCVGKLAMLELNIGPHDARVFYGPQNPFIIYGSQAKHTCFGQWIHDFRLVTDWRYDWTPAWNFKERMEMQRPPPYHPVEKNYFVFWDIEGHIYAHYDVAPQRVYAKLNSDGSVGPDLAPLTRAHDERCLNTYLGAASDRTLDHMHQATNSLAVVMCSRSEPGCVQTDTNTVLMTIFQQKTYEKMHSVYEPYVMLFEQRAPFQMHAVSRKPLWIHGRHQAQPDWPEGKDSFRPMDQSEMIYMTSMNWKDYGRNYTGFLDDKIFLGFGIEDRATGGMDVYAKDLLRGIGYCTQGD